MVQAGPVVRTIQAQVTQGVDSGGHACRPVNYLLGGRQRQPSFLKYLFGHSAAKGPCRSAGQRGSHKYTAHLSGPGSP
eukprot:scaffold79733_cov29-Phaeocystis_antarctica.AAC.3